MFEDFKFSETPFAWKGEKLNLCLKNVKLLLVVELGPGKAIPTVRNFSVRTAQMEKGDLIRINQLEVGVPKPHFLGLEMNILQALIELDARLSLTYRKQ